ncbi:MAG: hypothetical protein ABI707_19910 [Ferruginibacter sp.]
MLRRNVIWAEKNKDDLIRSVGTICADKKGNIFFPGMFIINFEAHIVPMERKNESLRWATHMPFPKGRSATNYVLIKLFD